MKSIYTPSEQETRTVDPDYAATAARYIIEEATGRKPKLNVSCLAKVRTKKVTVEKVNELTQQIVADTNIWS